MTNPEQAAISVIRGNTTYNLLNFMTTYSIMGAGPSPVRRITKRGPLQHGATDRGFRLEPRNMRLLAYFSHTTAEAYWNKRKDLADIFAPSDSNLILRFDLGNGERRHIKGHCLGFPMDSDPGQPGYQTVAVDIQCVNPTFFNPTGKSVSFSVSFAANTFQVPMDIPLFIGASTLDQAQTINYNGNWRSFPHRIRITGAITDPVITNNATGEKLDFTGTTIGGGDHYDIDLRYSRKTVVDSNGNNKIADLTDDSDLATWHIGAPPEVSGGQNDITATGSAIDSDTEILIQFYERYLGI